MADTPTTHYEGLGGCIWGGGKPGQGSGICRRVCDKGEKYCPHHLAIARAKAAAGDRYYAYIVTRRAA